MQPCTTAWRNTRRAIWHGRAPSAIADADLVPLLADAVGGDRIEPDRRQRDGDERQERNNRLDNRPFQAES